MDGRNGAYLFSLSISTNGRFNVNRGQTVPVGKQKWFAFGNVALDHLNPTGRHGVLPGVGERHGPVFLSMAVVELYPRFAPQAQRDIAGLPQIVSEIVLNHLPF